MVDVVRWASGRRPWAVWQPFVASGGPLRWVKLPSSYETSLLVSLSKFGDLRAYASLSRAAKFYHLHLATSLHCLEVEAERGDPQRNHLCKICGDLGLARAFASKCSNCEDIVCEGCVASASFSRKGAEGLVASSRAETR